MKLSDTGFRLAVASAPPIAVAGPEPSPVFAAKRFVPMKAAINRTTHVARLRGPCNLGGTRKPIVQSSQMWRLAAAPFGLAHQP